jgi:hypothetical protein
MKYLGIDIGGANIKLANTEGYAATRSFALWREPKRLSDVLAECLQAAPAHRAIAATTTGELADCFATKRDGICEIYTALAAATDCPIVVYLVDGRFVSPRDAIDAPQLAAASNWHALARFAGQLSGDALLIDVGSTTTDVIPLRSGEPVARGQTDTERLLHSELLYTGVTRTPVAALVGALPWRGQSCPVARELFATALDAHLMLGNLPEDNVDTNTADGRPATRQAARDRLARMIGADRETFDEADALAAAEVIATAQQKLLAEAIARVLRRLEHPSPQFILAGQGEFLAHQSLDALGIVSPRSSLRAQLGPEASQAAAAHAVAVLAEREPAAHGGPPRVTFAVPASSTSS